MMDERKVVVNQKTQAMVGAPTNSAYAVYLCDNLNKLKKNTFAVVTHDAYKKSKESTTK